MNTNANPGPTDRNTSPLHARGKWQQPSLLKLPGLIAISLYMLLLSGRAIIAVVEGKYPPIYLIFAALFITGALGLLLLLRWAWALTLAAVAILSGWSLWSFTSQHAAPALVQGLLNLIIFLYLVRGDVRDKLK